MNLNVFKNYTHPKNYYWSHPFKFLKETFYNFSDAKMRACKGYCYSDVWNLDDWFCEIIGKMLRDLADRGTAYPGEGEFDTPEKWHDWLYSIADLFEGVSEDEKNEYFEKMIRTSRDDPDYNEIRTLYNIKEDEIAKAKKVMLISAMQHFSKGIIDGLFWD